MKVYCRLLSQHNVTLTWLQTQGEFLLGFSLSNAHFQVMNWCESNGQKAVNSPRGSVLFQIIVFFLYLHDTF